MRSGSDWIDAFESVDPADTDKVDRLTDELIAATVKKAGDSSAVANAILRLSDAQMRLAFDPEMDHAIRVSAADRGAMLARAAVRIFGNDPE